jgi:hypothetical protein
MSAGDFYFAINATFRFIHDTYGKDALVDYWTSMAREYHAGVAERFRSGGLEEIRRYWTDYFAHEPGGGRFKPSAVSLTERGVELDVRDCPAIRWLKDGGREIVPYYCAHCDHISTAIAEQAGLTFSLEGGGGACRQLFATNGGAA